MLPDPRTPPPPRFLPEFDNVLLSHQDRTRVIAFEHRYVVASGTFLLDGVVSGTWSIGKETDASRLMISSFRPLKRVDRTGLAEEGERLIAFAAPSPAQTGIDFVVKAPTLPSPANREGDGGEKAIAGRR